MHQETKYWKDKWLEQVRANEVLRNENAILSKKLVDLEPIVTVKAKKAKVSNPDW